MKLKLSPLRLVTLGHLAVFVLVVTGVLPRQIVPIWTLMLVVWAAVIEPSQSVLFFTAAIPTFVAIPITIDFDNFNMWRLIAVVIFLRWFLATQSWRSIFDMTRSFLRRPLAYPVATCLAGLAVLALLSVTQAADISAALRRIILFTNVALVPFVAFAIARTNPPWKLRLLKAMLWSAILVTTAAFIQLVSTYLMDVYAFMRVWGEGIQLRQFGALWSYTAVHMGNTWLAYYGPQLSLRVFSLFTDSHSFPIYLLMAMGGIVAYALQPVTQRLAKGTATFTELIHTRARLSIIWVPLSLLAVILSGTRGIWAASIGLPLVFIVVARWLRNHSDTPHRLWWRYLAILLSCYYLLFAIAWPIFVSPQFLLSKGDWALLGNRVRSIIDFGETSNAQRLMIWRASVQSIAKHPLLGVGIGNFPVVLDQRIILAKAGSSAHNIWIHVAAEMGIPALVLFASIWVLLIISCLRVYARDRSWTVITWAGWMLFVIPWIAAYLLTDAALFDERALLMFGLILALARAADTSYAT
jgi:O-antigen ligase